MKSMLFSVVALGAFVYVCFCACLYLFQRSFIYFPVPAVNGVAAEEVWLESDEARLRVWRLRADRPHAILYFGGNAEDVSLNVREFGAWFPDQAIYLVNYRGYGGSSGSPSESGFHRDAEVVFDFIRSRHRRVSVVGRSLGAAVAVRLAATQELQRLVLITPFDSLAGLAREYYPIFPTSLLLREKYDALADAGSLQAPVLLIVAGRDEIIPRERSENLVQAILPSLLSVVVIEDATHNTIGAAAEYGRALRGFLAEPAARAAQQ
jgi:uncharacterized protein